LKELNANALGPVFVALYATTPRTQEEPPYKIDATTKPHHPAKAPAPES
jgi:hypothetical protein